MILSYTIPCHKRTEDLLDALPSVIAAAKSSPPVQIVIVDYGNPTPLADEIRHITDTMTEAYGITTVVYRGRDHYHMAHARNLSIRASIGEYVTIGATYIHLLPTFFPTIREELRRDPTVGFFRSITNGYLGVVTVRRTELIAAGGFDERFEFYGKEDRDLIHRLRRRHVPQSYYYLDDMLRLQLTSKNKKVRNYRLPLSLQEMGRINKDIIDENDRLGVLVANEGKEWGQL
jgi:hypothetical protein